jgi:serine/threonine protein kinase
MKKKDMALKKIRFESNEVVSKATIAEISAMRELKHPNIVSLIYVSMENNILNLIYEFFPIDLKKYMDNLPHGQLLETHLVKNYLHQITQGIYFLTVYI